MKNVEELRKELSEVFQALKEGSINLKQASEMTNVAGRMIASSKAQLEYYALRKESPKIPFLDA